MVVEDDVDEDDDEEEAVNDEDDGVNEEDDLLVDDEVDREGRRRTRICIFLHSITQLDITKKLI